MIKDTVYNTTYKSALSISEELELTVLEQSLLLRTFNEQLARLFVNNIPRYEEIEYTVNCKDGKLDVLLGFYNKEICILMEFVKDNLGFRLISAVERTREIYDKDNPQSKLF